MSNMFLSSPPSSLCRLIAEKLPQWHFSSGNGNIVVCNGFWFIRIRYIGSAVYFAEYVLWHLVIYIGIQKQFLWNVSDVSMSVAFSWCVCVCGGGACVRACVRACVCVCVGGWVGGWVCCLPFVYMHRKHSLTFKNQVEFTQESTKRTTV